MKLDNKDPESLAGLVIAYSQVDLDLADQVSIAGFMIGGFDTA